MTDHHPSDPRWRRLRLVGRLALATAAGGAFAVLAWEPRPPRETSQTDPEMTNPERSPDPSESADHTAVWQSIVKEDDALPRLMPVPRMIDRKQEWGLAQQTSKTRRGWPTGAVMNAPDDSALNGPVSTSLNQEAGTMTTGLPHSRAPP